MPLQQKGTFKGGYFLMVNSVAPREMVSYFVFEPFPFLGGIRGGIGEGFFKIIFGFGVFPKKGCFE
ncbi:MAG: hypothetical protein CM15mP58_13770 [Burkholderiaceae bacterium]|nr:MAG: hypothetical protein CM15mP58_13770 [Burkholderiaceae bacterium]